MPDIERKILSSEHILSLIVLAFSIALMVMVGFIFKKYATKVADSADKKRRRTMERIAADTARILIVLSTAILILQINGINVSSLVTSLGIVSVIVGLALQDPLRDIIMGLHILMDRFFLVGDVIEYKGSIGQVTVLNLQTTRIRDLETNSVLTICNRNIDEIRVMGNVIDIDIPLAYGEDTVRIHQVLEKTAEKIAALDTVNKCRYLGANSFNDSSISYILRLFVNPADRFSARRAAIRIIQDTLDNEGIEIPFNQLDVRIAGTSD